MDLARVCHACTKIRSFVQGKNKFAFADNKKDVKHAVDRTRTCAGIA